MTFRVAHITLFRPIALFCGTENIMWNILHIQPQCGEYSAKMPVPQNTAMGLDNVMH